MVRCTQRSGPNHLDGARLGNLLTSGDRLAVGVGVQAVAAASALSALVLSAPAQAHTADGNHPKERKNRAKPALDGFEKSNYARDIDPGQTARHDAPWRKVNIVLTLPNLLVRTTGNLPKPCERRIE